VGREKVQADESIAEPDNDGVRTRRNNFNTLIIKFGASGVNKEREKRCIPALLNKGRDSPRLLRAKMTSREVSRGVLADPEERWWG
jgi:hypothetical protein